MSSIRPRNNFHILVLVGGVAIIALFLPVFMGGGSVPGSDALTLIENTFQVVSNSTSNQFNATADNAKDILQLIAGDNMIITVNSTSDTFYFNATLPAGSGEANLADNVGGGTGTIFRDKTGVTLHFKTITTGGDGIIITNNANTIDFSLNNIAKSEIALAGTWIKAELPSDTLYRNGCNDGEVVKYQVSNTTWICAVDISGGAGDSITEGDSNVEVIDGGTGQVDIDIDGANQYTFTAAQADFTQNNLVNVGVLLEQTQAGGLNQHDFRATAFVADDTIIGELRFRALDGLSSPQNYARITATMEGDLNGSERGSLKFFVTELGTHDVLYMSMNDGGSGTIDLFKDLNTNGNNLLMSNGQIEGSMGCADGEHIQYQSSNSTWLCTGAVGGENTSASNVGSGVGVFDQETGDDLEFNSLIGGLGIDVTDTVQDLTIAIDSTVIQTTDNTTDLADTANIAYLNTANVYIDGNLQTFTDDDFRIGDNTGGQFYTFSTGDVSADRIVSLPVLTTNDVFVFQAATQTLTNKSIDADTNTITNIENADIKSGAAIDATKIADGSVTSGEFQFINTLSSNAQTQINTKISDVTGDNLEALANVVPTGCADTEHLMYQTSNSTWICTGAVGGENTSASNLGSGFGVFSTEVGDDLRFDSLIGGNAITITDTTDDLTFSVTANSIDDAELGTGIDTIQLADGSVTETEFQFINTLASNAQTQINTKISDITGEPLEDLSNVVPTGCANTEHLMYQTSNSTWICTGAVGGENTSASNLGTGFGIFAIEVGDDLRFDSLIGGVGIDITDTTDDLTFSIDGTVIQTSDSTTDLSDTANIAYLNTANNYIDGNLQTFTDDDFRLQDNTGGQFYTFSTGNLVADRIVSLPVLGANDVFVFQAATQTLSGKSIDADTNTITNIENADIKSGAAIDATKIADGSVTSGEFQFINTLSSNAQTQINTKISDITGEPLEDLSNVVNGCADSEHLMYQTSNSTWICTGAVGGENTSASNLGSGFGVFSTEVGDDLRFDSLIGGNAITITDTTDDLTFEVTADSIDDAELGTGIDTIQLADGSVTEGEFQFINTLSSNAQTQLDTKLESVLVDTLQYDKGSDEASAAIMTPADDGNVFDITGAVTINEITPAGWQAGTIIHLQFDGAPTVTHNSGGTNDIMLADDLSFVAVAGDVLSLFFDGTDWIEVSRSVVGGGAPDIISEGDSNVEVIDGGTGQVDIDVDGANQVTITATIIDVQGNILTDLAVPTTTTEAQRADNFGLLGTMVISACNNDDILKWQVSNTTWVCSADAGAGGGITSINSDSDSTQLFLGTASELTITDTGVGELTWDVGTDIVQIDQANTYENGNLQTFTDDDIRIEDNTGGQFYTISAGDIAADRVISLPVLTGNDVFVFQAATQTLSNKSIDADTNTLTNIESSDMKTAVYTNIQGLATQTQDLDMGSQDILAVKDIVLNGRLDMDKGTDEVAATELTLATDGNIFDITGATTINTISPTGWTAGAVIYLHFDSNPQVTHNSGGTNDILLGNQANYATLANDVLALYFDGTDWVEIARSASMGENTSASNVGTGEDVFSTEVGDDLRFNTLIGGNAIDITDTTDDLTFAVTANSIDDAELGTGIDTIQLADGSVTETEFQFINTLASNAQTQINTKISDVTGDNIEALANVVPTGCANTEHLMYQTSNSTWICTSAVGGENTSASNIGTGFGVFATEVGDDLRFDSLIGGNAITITDTTDDLTFAVTANSIDDAELGTGIDTIQLADGSVTETEFQFINTLASNAQTQLNNKLEDITGEASTDLTDTANIAYLNTANVFIDTNMQTFADDFIEFRNPANTFDYILSTGAIVADRTISLPVLAGNDVFVFQAATQTLSNKSIDADTNTITNIENADIKAGADITLNKLEDVTSGNIIVGSSGNVPTSVNPSGDIDVTNTGVFSIASNVIVDGDVQSGDFDSITGIGTQTQTLAMGGNDITAVGDIVLQGVLDLDKGTDEVAATELTLTTDGNVFDITGATTINTISPTGFTLGAVIYLQFDGAPQVTHNSGGTNDILLGDQLNFATSAGDVLSLFFDGTDWVEISRSVVNSGSGENTSASNLGTGFGVFATEVGDDLRFDSLIGGNAITITDTTDDLTFEVTANSIDDAELGTGIDTIQLADGSVTEAEFQFINTLGSNAQTQIDTKISDITGGVVADLSDTTNGCANGEILEYQTSNSTWICGTDDGGADATTASNLGSGFGVFATEVGDDLQFDSLIGGTGIDITDTTDDLTFAIDGTVIQTSDSTTDLADTANIAYLNTANVFIDTNMQTFADDFIEFRNPANTFDYILSTGAIVADRAISLPVLAGNDVFVFQAATQTLTNKSIDADTNTITNIENADIKAGAAITFNKLENLSDGNILVGSSGNVPTSVNPSGDIDVTNTGVFSISSGVIVDGDLQSGDFDSITGIGTQAQTLAMGNQDITAVGDIVLTGVLDMDKGTDEVAATELTLTTDGNVFDITGATTINTISPTGFTLGAVIYLQFDGAPQVTHNSGGTNDILLGDQSNFATSAGDVLSLFFDGTDWVEISRSVVSSGGAENTSASNIGTGLDVFATEVGDDLRFNTLIAGNAIDITDTTDDLTFAVTANSIDDAELGTGIDTIQLADGSVTEGEFQFINTLSSNAQTQLDGKLTDITGEPSTDLTDTANIAYLNTPNVFIDSNMQTFADDFIEFRNPANTFDYILSTGALVADRTITLPLLTGNDVFVFQAMIQTLSNKSIDADTNTITNIEDADIKAGAAIVMSKITGTSAQFDTANSDGNFFLNADNISQMATSTSSQFDTANSDGTFFLNADNISNMATSTTAQFNTANSDGTFVTIEVVNTYSDGIKQTFNPDATNAGLNIGLQAGEPSSPVEGDIFYDSTANQFKGRDDGAWINLGAGAGGGEINTASNVGTGIGVFDIKNVFDLEFNSLIGGTGITVADTTQDLTISIDGSEFATTALSDTANVAYLNTANTWTTGTQNFGSLTITGFDIDCDEATSSCINVDTADFIGVAEPKIAVLTAGGATLQATLTPEKVTLDGTNMDYIVLDFDTTVSETVVWNWEVPDNMDASADIVVRVRAQVLTGTAGICWDGSWLGRTAGETVDAAFGTVIGGCDSSTGVLSIETATLTFNAAAHGLAAGDTAFFKLSRDVADATDTNANDARLIDVRVTWS